MIEWIVNQQAALSIALVFLILLERMFCVRVGIGLMYRLWLLVPLVLIVNNLPLEDAVVVTNSYARYVVNVTPSLAKEDVNSLFIAWISGIIVLSLYTGYHSLKLLRSLRKSACFGRPVYVSEVVSTPLLFGLISPKIVVPTDFDSVFEPTQQRLILEHENTHYKHGDHVWNALALLLLILCWFNPFIWLGVRSFRTSQELACDNNVLRQKTFTERKLYAKALVQCAEHTSVHLTSYPTLGGKSTMLKRLNFITKPTKVSKTLAVTSSLLALALSANTVLAKLPQQTVNMQKVNEAMPVKRVDPVYPAEAVENNQEGSVTLQFDINEDGATDNITIVESKPANIFNDSAKTALAQWQYKPRIQGGKAQRQTDLLVQLDFKLSPPAQN